MQATPENIRQVVMLSPYLTLQPTVSASVIQSYVNAIEAGQVLPPIYVDMDVIVDGNHRYIAGLLCRKPVPEQPWTKPLTKQATSIHEIQVMT
jgi:hypothetical protein